MHRRYRQGEAVLDFGVVQDVTAERDVALALHDRLTFIQKVTSRVPGVVFQLRRKPDGSFQFLYISEPVREIYGGVSPEEVLRDASRTLSLHHPDDLPGFLSTLMESARELTPWRHEYRLRFADGSVTWLSGQAVPEAEADGGVVWNGVTTDITPRKLVQERLGESEARFRALTKLSADWYWEQDAQFRFVRFEGAMVAGAGKGAVNRIGKTRWEVGALNMRAADWDQHRAALQAHETFHDLELQEIDAQGRKFWMTISGEPIFDAQGVFKGYRGIGRNITGRKRAEEKIERLAFFDLLTGLPNRRLLMDRLQHALALGDRARRPGALLFIDLDNFKDLNDTQGHDTGDQLLKQVAIRLGECVRSADTVARLGGDEFVVMLEDLSNEPPEAAALAESVARKILTTLNQPYRLGGQVHHSTPSIGIALFHDQISSVDDLLKRADLAMYQAKAAGRNTLRFFDPQMQVVVAARAELEGDLRLGLQRDELLLHYQPVVDESARVIGVEALVRWRHPKRGLVSPGEFIGVAEQTGLILPLGQWVLAQACAQLVAWSALPTTARLTVAVNVSARQFRHAEFATQVLELLRVSGANPYRLKLEITESLLLSDMDDAIQKMTELRSIGVSFALDDFGTGYSSLAYLKRLPLEQLKIDQSFVRDVMTDPNDAAIALAVLTLGRSLGLTVVAEGVETPEQHALLRNHGCCVFQGYLFGRPVPIEALDLRSAAQAVSSVNWMI
ncbi:MAG: EAL domain-containing protein [Rhodoferax sp.]|nr:EAL domain-containing protein [Rhodoferax sp.]